MALHPYAIDWEGIVLGELTVTSYAGRVPAYGKRGEKGLTQDAWNVKCSCGNEIVRTSTYLNKLEKDLNGINKQVSIRGVTHCNENPIHIMPCKLGEDFGYLKVIDFPKNTHRKTVKDVRWMIACLCSACEEYSHEKPYLIRPDQWNKKVEAKNLRGSKPSCGCMVNVKHGLSRRRNDDGRIDAVYELWLSARQRARDQGLPIDDDLLEQLQSLGIPEKCPVLGIPLFKPEERGRDYASRTPNSPSLDKFIPELGYVKGNFQIISWRANELKKDGTPEEWDKIAKWSKKKNIKSKFNKLT